MKHMKARIADLLRKDGVSGPAMMLWTLSADCPQNEQRMTSSDFPFCAIDYLSFLPSMRGFLMRILSIMPYDFASSDVM